MRRAVLALAAQAPAAAEGTHQTMTVPFEAVRLVSRRWLGLVEMPSLLQSSVESAAAAAGRSSRQRGRAAWDADGNPASSREGGSSMKQLRGRSLRLTDALQRLSRTEARGGVHERPELDPGSGHRARIPRRKSVRPDRLLEELRRDSQIMNVDEFLEEHSIEEPPPPQGEAGAQVRSDALGRVHYVDEEVAAYAATRLPACYSVLVKVFHELRLRLPELAPHRMMDFGSGPGTAIWAACQVWGVKGPREVLAVEASGAMSRLASRVWQDEAVQQAVAPDATPPRVRWMSRLPRESSGGNKRMDMVVASYVIGELRSESERRRVVDALWQRTGGVLVLLEPGTPVGSANIREARAQILAAERPKAGVRGVAGAYVVAPCPHDGGCPLDGTRNWCHFMQRFRRSPLQLKVKTLSGGHGPRTYQDERFSYVVLRRGARPGAAVDLQIARHLVGDPAPDPELYRTEPAHWKERRTQEQEALAAEVEAEAEESDDDVSFASLDLEAQNLVLESIMAGFSDDEDDEEASALLMEHLRAELLQDEEGGQDTNDAEIALDSDGDHGIELKTSGIDNDHETNHSEDNALVNDFAALVTESAASAAVTESGLEYGEVAANASSAEDSPLDGDSDDDESKEVVNWEERDPVAVAACNTASGSWPRVIRRPGKRSRHVVLDLCSRQPGDTAGTERGVIIKQIITKGDSQRLGVPGYRLARKARWGDLWPAPFQQPAE